MPQYRWSPPEHPDPPEDQPLGVPGVEWSERVGIAHKVWLPRDQVTVRQLKVRRDDESRP